jgi:hypothetical protein
MRLRLRTQPDPPAKAPLWQRLSETDEYRELCRVRLEHRVEVREPLVLISQIQRSGGTLLLQLFDAHPECHTDPYELKIGHPGKEHWPPLDLAAPETWFELLGDSTIGERLRPTERTKNPRTGRNAFPFAFLPHLQRAIFAACVESTQPQTEREVLDCYFTSYFNAWLDNQTLYDGPKRAVVGFVPRLAMERDSLAKYFDAYPDGTLISIVRDPRAWYRSASRHWPARYGDLDVGLALWRDSVEAGLEARERYGERVLLLAYERLALDPEPVIRAVAERIGIAFLPLLLEPTFNGLPIRANSSGTVERLGIVPERVDAYRDELDEQTIARIDSLAGDLYERATAHALAR